MIKSLVLAAALSIGLAGYAFAQNTITGAPAGTAPETPAPGDPPPDPGDNPRPDGVAFKPDAAPGKQEQGKGQGLSPPHAPHATQTCSDARDLSSGPLKPSASRLQGHVRQL